MIIHIILGTMIVLHINKMQAIMVMMVEMWEEAIMEVTIMVEGASVEATTEMILNRY